MIFFFFSSRRRHTRYWRDWSSDVCSSDLVLGLDDGVALPAGLRIGAEAAAMLREGLGHRGRGRDRVPGADGRAAIDRAEAGRVVALEEDAVADRVRPAHLEADRLLEMLLGVVPAHVQRFVVRWDELVLALELLGDELLDLRNLDAEEIGEGADIDDVLEQLALARVGVALVDDRSQRHADDVDVGPELRLRQGAGRVVEEVSA